MSSIDLRSRDWEVRTMVSLSVHAILGLRGQLFEFRRQGESRSYTYFFVGGGAGMGAGAGGGVNAPGPIGFARDTARTVGTAFHEAGRQLIGRPRRSRNEMNLPDFGEELTAFTPIESLVSFSPADLHHSMGRVGSASASLALGYGSTVISAWNMSGVFFESQVVTKTGEVPASGTAGVSASVSLDLGAWIMA